MSRYLPFAIFFIVATSLMGAAVIAVLTMRQFTGAGPLMIAAAAGLVLALPVTWFVTKQLR